MAPYRDDTALFHAFQEGRSDAEKLLFSRLFKPLCVYAVRITGSTEGAEDIVIESFHKTWERRAQFPSFEDLSRFIYKIVRNASLSLKQTEKLHAGIHSRIHYLHARDVEEGDADEREILRAELLQEIYQEIEALPDRCREIFKLIFLQGLSTDQIASQLSLNVQTVRSQKARAIELIRTRLLKKNQILALFLLYSILENL